MGLKEQDTLLAGLDGWRLHNFTSGFLKVFVPAVQDRLKTGPVLLFVDGHNSHLALDVLGLARANNITIYCPSPNTTHILQPGCWSIWAP